MGARGASEYQIHKLDYKTKWYVYTRITPCEWVGGSAGLEKASVVCELREADMLLLKQSSDIWMRGDSVADATTSA